MIVEQPQEVLNIPCRNKEKTSQARLGPHSAEGKIPLASPLSRYWV